MRADTISAGELRSMGIKLPEEIPDVATVPRSALDWSTRDVEQSKEPGTLTIGMSLTINASFSWVVIDYEISKNENNIKNRG